MFCQSTSFHCIPRLAPLLDQHIVEGRRTCPDLAFGLWTGKHDPPFHQVCHVQGVFTFHIALLHVTEVTAPSPTSGHFQKSLLCFLLCKTSLNTYMPSCTQKIHSIHFASRMLERSSPFHFFPSCQAALLPLPGFSIVMIPAPFTGLVICQEAHSLHMSSDGEEGGNVCVKGDLL